AFANRARVGFFLAGDHAKQRRLAGAVWTNHADDAAGRKRERHVFDEKFWSVALAYVLRFDHNVAETWTGRNVNLEIFATLFTLLPQQVFVRVDPRFAFCMP